MLLPEIPGTRFLTENLTQVHHGCVIWQDKDGTGILPHLSDEGTVVIDNYGVRGVCAGFLQTGVQIPGVLKSTGNSVYILTLCLQSLPFLMTTWSPWPQGAVQQARTLRCL